MTTSELIARLASLPDSPIFIYNPETDSYQSPIVDVVRCTDGVVMLSQWPLDTDDSDDDSPATGGIHL